MLKCLTTEYLINTKVDFKKNSWLCKKALCFSNSNTCIKNCFDLYPVTSPNPLQLTENLKLQISQKYR